MTGIISRVNSERLSLCLKQIYEYVVFEGNESLAGDPVIKSIIEAVEESGKAQKEHFLVSNPGMALVYDNHEDLVGRFFDRASNIIHDITQTASSIAFSFSKAADILMLVVPYTLIRFGTQSVNAAFFSGLAIAISKIIVEFVSQNKERREKVNNNDLRQLCQLNIDYLQKIDGDALTQELKEYLDALLLFSASLEAELKDK